MRSSRRFKAVALACTCALTLLGSSLLAAPALAITPTPNAANHTLYALPNGQSGDTPPVPDDNGNMWFPDFDQTTSTAAIARISSSGLTTEYPIPGATGAAYAIVAGPDGNMWFSTSDNFIGKVTPAGVVTTYKVSNGRPTFMLVGPDGNMWFDFHTDAYGEQRGIGRISMSGTITFFDTPPSGDSAPVIGADGNIWFIEYDNQKLVRVTTAGSVTEFNIPVDVPGVNGSVVHDLVAGNDSELWFVETTDSGPLSYTSNVIKMSTAGVFTKLAPSPADTDVHSLIAGNDGNMWAISETLDGANITGTYRAGITKLVPSGTQTTYSVSADSADGITSLVAGPNNQLWFSWYDPSGQLRAPGIGWISTAGVSTLFPVAGPDHLIRGLTNDSDGNLWYSQELGIGNLLGVFRPTITSRVWGADRYSGAVKIAQAAYPSHAPVVYIATGTNYPDALSAAPAAAERGGPLLLVQPTGLPDSVKAEIQSLAPSKIVVVGGSTAVSDTVFNLLKLLVPDTERQGGSDRYESSRNVSKAAFTAASTVFLATGGNFPDALSATSPAHKQKAPVVLVNGSAPVLDQSTLQLLKSFGVQHIVITGGPNSISTGIEQQLKTLYPDTLRLGGTDRYATSITVNAKFFTTASSSFVATGTNFPDALAGGVLAAVNNSPLLVVQPSCLASAELQQLRLWKSDSVTLLGGPAALGTSVETLTSCG